MEILDEVYSHRNRSWAENIVDLRMVERPSQW
jgi:hypothetical protein